jgi:tetratricopeptide (TPR) repeat protein
MDEFLHLTAGILAGGAGTCLADNQNTGNEGGVLVAGLRAAPASASNGVFALPRVTTSQNSLCGEFLQGLARRFGIRAFVETGTYLGGTAEAAAGIFEEVHTIELSAELAQRAAARLAARKNVHVHAGDSAILLPQILSSVRGPVLVWLDGHYSEGETARGDSNTPILRELRAMQESGRKDAIILIDDLRLFDLPKADPNLPKSIGGYPPLTTLHQLLSAMGYQFFVLGDVGIALSNQVDCPVSPLVAAMTISRLYDGNNLPIEEVVDAEQFIVQASGEQREALGELGEQHSALEKFGLALHYRFWHGLNLLGERRFDEAALQLARAGELGFSHWRLKWYLAIARQQLGQTASARKTLDEVIRAAPKFAAARTLRSELDSAKPAPSKVAALAAPAKPTLPEGSDARTTLEGAGLWSSGEPLKLHLGCGEQYLKGYVNIDYPPDQHNVMKVCADAFANVMQLHFNPGTVDEIRLHHVFEHFNRVTALAMLMRWHEWIKIGGILRIETPDLVGSAKCLASNAPLKLKMAAARHLAGDQAASWAYHVDHWFPARYEDTLRKLGFDQLEIKSTTWPHSPFLANVEVIGTKSRSLSPAQLLEAADTLLWDSTVAESERPTYEVWRKQLRAILTGQPAAMPCHVPSATTSAANPILSALSHNASKLPLDEIHSFNQRDRDRWVAEQAARVLTANCLLTVSIARMTSRSMRASSWATPLNTARSTTSRKSRKSRFPINPSMSCCAPRCWSMCRSQSPRCGR